MVDGQENIQTEIEQFMNNFSDKIHCLDLEVHTPVPQPISSLEKPGPVNCLREDFLLFKSKNLRIRRDTDYHIAKEEDTGVIDSQLMNTAGDKYLISKIALNTKTRASKQAKQTGEAQRKQLFVVEAYFNFEKGWVDFKKKKELFGILRDDVEAAYVVQIEVDKLRPETIETNVHGKTKKRKDIQLKG